MGSKGVDKDLGSVKVKMGKRVDDYDKKKIIYKEISSSGEESDSGYWGNAPEKRKGYDSDSSSDSDYFEKVTVKKKRLKTDEEELLGKTSIISGDSGRSSGKETELVTPCSSRRASEESDRTRYSDSEDGEEPRDGSESPEVPEGQWEIEEILDYMKDDFGGHYLVKWKDWEEHYNTWEQISNLLNCDEELLRFYQARKLQNAEAKEKSEYVILPSGKLSRKGPRLVAVPPDPRPWDKKVQDYFDMTGDSLSEREIKKVFEEWKQNKDKKGRWSDRKLEEVMEEGMQGNLSKSDAKRLKHEIILRQVEENNVELRKEIKSWEKKINKITKGRPCITVENNVDLDGPPKNFQFINEYIAGDGIEIPTDPPVGCGCCEKGMSCYENRDKCCAMQSGYKFAYTRFGKINLMQGSPVYECNSKCKCGPDCPNRVVQDGKNDHRFCIFRTDNGRGWGVKTQKSIKKDTFVTLYVGEVIEREEADRRGKIYDKDGCTYLWDLDFNDPDNYPYSVDAKEYGNVSHFINHSCSPNLGVYAVWVDCLDPNLPKLAMFALRDIAKDEELTVDYNRALSSKKKIDYNSEEEENDEMRNKGKKTRCLCGTSNCRKYIFS